MCACNLFLPTDTLTGKPGVIQKKHSKGPWINKGLWAFTRVVRREGCVYFSWLLSQHNAALTEQVEPVQSHGGSSAFYSTYVPALALFVFGRLMCCILLSLSEKGFCTCKSQELNYRALSRYGTSDKIYSIYSCCLRCCFFFLYPNFNFLHSSFSLDVYIDLYENANAILFINAKLSWVQCFLHWLRWLLFKYSTSWKHCHSRGPSLFSLRK